MDWLLGGITLIGAAIFPKETQSILNYLQEESARNFERELKNSIDRAEEFENHYSTNHYSSRNREEDDLDRKLREMREESEGL